MYDVTIINLDSQQKTVSRLGAGVHLVLAGAGSGKTSILTTRVANLIASGVDPSEILLLTFTNKAANEMIARTARLSDKPLDGLWAGTFHAIAARVLRRAEVGLVPPRFGILDEDDAELLLKGLAKDHGPEGFKVKSSVIKGIISYCRNTREPLSQHLAERHEGLLANEPVIAKIAQAYADEKLKMNVLDFDDLLISLLLVLELDHKLRAELQQRFRFILVDEAQDTNAIQWDILKILSAKHRNLMVVGDADQCFVPGTKIKTENGEKPIELIQPGDKVLSAIGGGKSNFFRVSEVKKRIETKEIIVIKTHSGKEIRCTAGHALFTKITPNPDTHHVYLMFRKDLGFRIGVTGGVRASDKISHGVSVRSRQEKADASWVLKTALSRAEALVYEQVLSANYGIPQTCFEYSGSEIKEEQIKKIFSETNSRKGAESIMKDFGLSFDSPHWRQSYGESSVSVTYLSRRSDRDTMTHKIHWETPNEALVAAASGKDLKIKKAKPFKDGRLRWRASTERVKYEEAREIGKVISQRTGAHLVERFAITSGSSWEMTPASNVFPGMVLPSLSFNNEIIEDAIVSVSRENYYGDVYDLNVEEVHNYTANDVIVHNCIYGFRGASIAQFLAFPRQFSECERFDLDVNYRSTAPIVRLADASIQHNQERFDREAYASRPVGDLPTITEYASEDEEADTIAWRIKRDHAYTPLDQIAVLYRSAHQGAKMQLHLARRGIPFTVKGGTPFFSLPHVKDAMAWLRILSNPRDKISWTRCITAFPGIGKATFDKIWAQLEAAPLERVSEVTSKAKGWVLFVETFSAFQRLALSDLEAAMRVVTGELPRQALVKSDPLNHEDRWAELDVLVSMAADYDDAVTFLEDATLAEKGSDSPLSGVQLSTIHGAKGLEWRHVYLIGVNEGRFPSPRATTPADIEEERRVFYVGVTRAIETLHLSFVESLVDFGGGQELAYPSRFLLEIPEPLADWRPRPATIS